MNKKIITGIFTSLSLLLLATTGCRHDYAAGSPYQVGPVAGQSVGTGIGAVAGNVTGFGVGVVEGTARGVGDAMNPSYHMVRVWQTETTPDGRTIQVPHDILVDQYGRPAVMPAPTGNSKPTGNVAPPPPPPANVEPAPAPPVNSVTVTNVP